MSVKQKRWLWVLLLISAVVAVDLISKQSVSENLALGETREPVGFLAPYFQITLSYNTGAAFGMLPDAGNIFLIVAIVIVIGMMFFFNRIPDNGTMTRVGIGFIVGGALGNAIDRIQHGHVIDFIHYSLPQLNLSNVSNLADHAIVLGVILVLIDSWRLERLEKAADAADSSSATPNISGETGDRENIV
jgi:signal peptidase II